MKYNKEVSKLLLKLKNKDQGIKLSGGAAKKAKVDCSFCSCHSGEHDDYIYCKIVDDYICDVCCRYEVCNDYQLVNQVLDKEIFSENSEVIMLCEHCS
ncbi:hypothetical protein MWH28_09990 [Natroniella sulfidigena]|uniref:hypothetical protein n=1 Tax=Natroniella sulfidigena TaxID=723921 RepID=UPI00200B8D10|nr:hypothetical protein [Natroniella sulfidigena]MCK8817689.1 hypothetical protein [Natroniella sulfidigena]